MRGRKSESDGLIKRFEGMMSWFGLSVPSDQPPPDPQTGLSVQALTQFFHTVPKRCLFDALLRH